MRPIIFKFELVYDKNYSTYNDYKLNNKLIKGDYSDLMFYIPHKIEGLTKHKLNKEHVKKIQIIIEQRFFNMVQRFDEAKLLNLLKFHYPNELGQQRSFLTNLKTMLSIIQGEAFSKSHNIHVIKDWISDSEHELQNKKVSPFSATVVKEKGKIADDDTLLTVSDVCKHFGISRTTEAKWCKAGILKPKFKGRRKFYIKKDVLDYNPKRRSR